VKYKLNEIITAKHDYMMDYGLKEFTAGKVYSPHKYTDDIYFITNDSGCEHMLNEKDMDEIFADIDGSNAFDDAMSIVN